MGKSFMRPGFRFHPTDDELVVFYLKKKLLGKKIDPEVIAEINMNDFEPWELSAKSILSGDRKWYFFWRTSKKYSSGSRMNRTTKNGYWKGTGKDKEVKHKGRVVATRKTLIFHVGRNPNGTRTNWVMREFRMTDDDLAEKGVDQDAYVVCKVYEKSGLGPKNGEQYGTAFEFKEQDDDDNDGSTVTSTMMFGVLVNPNNVNMTSSEAGPSTVTSLTVVGLSGATKMLDPNASTSGLSTLMDQDNEGLTVVPVNHNTQEVENRKRKTVEVEDHKGKKVMTDPVNENDVPVNDDVMLTDADIALMFLDYGTKEEEDPKGKKVMTVPVDENDSTFEDLMALCNKDLGQDDFNMFSIDEFADERMIDDEFAADRMTDDEFQKYMEELSPLN